MAQVASDAARQTASRPSALPTVVAAALTVIGVALTTYAELAHVSVVVAPGALLSFVGGGWLGVALARRPVSEAKEG